MRTPLIERLQERVLIGDGAMGTRLQALGAGRGEALEAWNLTHPEAVRSVSQLYRAAGSEVLQTNTLGGNLLRLRDFGLAGEVFAVNRAGAELARQAAGEDGYVLGSMGPTGRLLEPLGDLGYEVAVEAYRAQAEGLAAGGVDGLLLETFMDLEEMRAAFEAASRTGLPVLGTLVFDRTGRTMMGVSVASALGALAGWGAVAVGANCGSGPEAMRPVILQMAGTTDLPLIAQPNAGVATLVQGQTVWGATPESMADFAEWCVGRGVRLVGGCCGSTPDHIRAIARRLGRGPLRDTSRRP